VTWLRLLAKILKVLAQPFAGNNVHGPGRQAGRVRFRVAGVRLFGMANCGAIAQITGIPIVLVLC